MQVVGQCLPPAEQLVLEGRVVLDAGEQHGRNVAGLPSDCQPNRVIHGRSNVRIAQPLPF